MYFPKRLSIFAFESAQSLLLNRCRVGRFLKFRAAQSPVRTIDIIMEFRTTQLDGLMVIQPRRFGDDRGWFSETWNAAAFKQAEIETDWVQDNHSFSAQKNTLRGLHFQKPPHAQAKLVRCTRGSIWDVAVDYRKQSDTYLQHVGCELSAQNGLLLFVPAGFLHGFVTLEPDCEVQYKCSAAYAPESDGAIRWNDPDIAVDWLGVLDPILSSKDAQAPCISQAQSPF